MWARVRGGGAAGVGVGDRRAVRFGFGVRVRIGVGVEVGRRSLAGVGGGFRGSSRCVELGSICKGFDVQPVFICFCWLV